MAARLKSSEPRPAPRLYLTTPPVGDADARVIAGTIAQVMTTYDVAAVLLRLADGDERSLINRIKAVAPAVQQAGAALLVDGHADLVARGGADGAHLTGIADFNDARDTLKPDRIVGCGGLATRHDAMSVAEAGADYVMFGEPNGRGGRPSFAAIEERVAWWAEVFEVPCVAYAASLDEVAPLVKAGADFVALGDWLWREPHAVATTLARVTPLMRLPEPAE